MPGRHFYRFPSVDFFGKSMPGVLFTLLGVLMVPNALFQDIIGTVEETGLAVVVTVFFVVFVVGFTIGQGLNTVSIVFQKYVLEVGVAVSEASNALRASVDEVVDSAIASDASWTEGRVVGIVRRVGVGLRTGRPGRVGQWLGSRRSEVVGWYLDRHRNFKRIFVPHRVAFEDWIKRHRAEQRRDQPKIDLFEEQYRKLLGDFHETGPTFPAHGSKPREVDVPEDTYLLVSDYLTHHGVNRARRHKALFCQNTAVALLFYAVVILDRRFRLSLLTPDPDTVLAHLIHQDVIHPAWPLPVGLLLASLVFLYATGVYKEFYLEYLIVDFVHSYNEAGGTAGPDGAD